PNGGQASPAWNAVDGRPQRAATHQASAARRSGAGRSPLTVVPGRSAPGSQTSAAAAAGIAQVASAARQEPPSARSSGTATAAPSVAPSGSAAENAPVS